MDTSTTFTSPPLCLPPPPQNAMQIVGFMEDEVQSVLELVAAILKLGNIEFKPESRVNGFDESRVKDKNGEAMSAPVNGKACFHP